VAGKIEEFAVRVENWNPEKITAEIEKKAMDRLERAAGIVAASARQKVPFGEGRPPYKSGKAWTERIPGTLQASIRVVRLKGDPKLNIRVYAGARQSDKLTAYYAHMVEMGTVKMRARPFLRPALNENKASIKNIMENG
jgi:HK97 gp10 family phage protein